MSLPYKSHPIYNLRRALLLTGSISILFSLLSALSGPYDVGLWIWHLVASLASLALCTFDLFTWAAAKAADPDNDPPWPLKKFMLGDVVLGVVFALTYLAELGSLAGPWRPYGSPVPAYASITALASAVLHGVCFWKALMRRKKALWLAELTRGGYQCVGCARAENAGAAQSPPSTTAHRSHSASDRDLESGVSETECLITPITEDGSGGGGGYQSQGYDAMGGVGLTEQILDGDAVVVKKKQRKNGKVGEKLGKSGTAPLGIKMQVEEYLEAASGAKTAKV